MNLKNKTVLVTGGAGFIGSHLVERLIKENPKKIIVVDNFYLGKSENIKSKDIKICSDNAASQETMQKIISKYNVEVIFNLAVTPLPASLIDPKFCFDMNVNITMVMCELLRLEMYETLIHFSSSEVYGTAKYTPMDENHPLNGITPYAASKASSDLLVLSYYKTFGIDTSIVRPFNTYGPRQNDKNYSGVIPLTMRRIIENKHLIIQGNGKQTRDFSYVTDVVDDAVKIYKCQDSRGKVVNIASGEEITIEEVIKILNTKRLPIVYENKRLGDVDQHLADISLAKKLINYSPRINYKDGLEKTKRWYEK